MSYLVTTGGDVVTPTDAGPTNAAATDAMTPDARLPDGGADDAADASRDGGRMCRLKTPFSDGFERSTVAGNLWTGPSGTDGGGTLAIDPSVHAGTSVAGSSLRVDVLADTASRSKYLDRELPAGECGVHVAFSLELAPGAGADSYLVASIETNDQTHQYSAFVTLDTTSGNLLLEELGGGVRTTHDLGSISPSTFVRVAFGIDLSGPVPRLHAEAGTTVYDEPAVVPFIAPSAVHIGVPYAAAGTTTATYWIDDVTVD